MTKGQRIRAGHASPPPIATPHAPVLLAEVARALGACADGLVVDGTFGAGGYSRALLAAGGRVLGIDRDPSVVPFADALAAEFGAAFAFKAGEFAELDALAADAGDVCAVVLDIGVSSMQLDQAERGFSFMQDGPLDMRMSASGPSAADLVNTLDEETIATILFAYGEEKRSRRIAKAIVAARPLTRTGALAALIEKTVGRKPGESHPATRSFQALRIAVNGEIDQLVEGLFAAERLLTEGGILAVVTFHSLEDRIVKRFFSPDKAAPVQSRHMPERQMDVARWRDVAKPVKAGPDELVVNPRARSATLRVEVRTGAPARAVERKGLGVPGVRREWAA